MTIADLEQAGYEYAKDCNYSLTDHTDYEGDYVYGAVAEAYKQGIVDFCHLMRNTNLDKVIKTITDIASEDEQ